MRHFVQSSYVPSDFNLTSFSLWFNLSEAEERRKAESLYVLVHRPVQSFPEFRLRGWHSMAAAYTTMLRSWMRQMPQWTKWLPFPMGWTVDVSTRKSRRPCYGTTRQQGVNVEIPIAEQSIIVDEQSHQPWVPSPGASNYAATQTMRRSRGFLRSPGRRRTLWPPLGSGSKCTGT